MSILFIESVEKRRWTENTKMIAEATTLWHYLRGKVELSS